MKTSPRQAPAGLQRLASRRSDRRLTIKYPRRRLLRLTAGAVVLSGLSSIASAQAYPTRPVRVIVPYAPGSVTDSSARLIAQKLSETVGKQFYVENISGAGGNIAMGRAAQAAPDGYTVLAVSSPYVINPALYDKVPYEPLKSFEPVTLAGTTNVVLAINPSVPAQSVGDLIALIKANPAKYSYASGGGIGSSGHLVGEQFRLSVGLDLVHVPFNGANLAVEAVVAGHVPIGFVAPAPAVPLVRVEKLRALAGSGKTRLHTLADVPTLAEAGYPAIEGDSWFGFVVPGGTPKEIIALLNREIVRAVALSEIKERFNTIGIEPVGSTPEEFTTRIKAEIDIWRRVIRTTGIRAE